MTEMAAADESGGGNSVRWRSLLLGLGVAAAFQLVPRPEGTDPDAWIVGSIVILMAVLWVTEALPLAVTGLIPLVALPLLTDTSPREAAAQYANPIMYVFLGGFLLAIAIERWRLSSRLAFTVVATAGPRPKLIVAGFIAATAFISMWISNTATSLMMTPLAVGVAAAAASGGRTPQTDAFGMALVLGVMYAASLGGIGTPIGSPTNLIAIAWLTENTGQTVSFGAWMMLGVPALLVLLPAGWFLLARNLTMDADRGAAAGAKVRESLRGLGPVTEPERRVAFVFAAMALLWMFAGAIRTLPGLGGVEDMTVAIAGALALFLIPAGNGEKRSLLVWDDAAKVPWGIILLFGGGLSIAEAATTTGLVDAMSQSLGVLQGLPPILLVGLIIFVMIMFTEVASNVATITLMLPLLGALSTASGVPPEVIVVPAAIAASCAFMMPAGTAPNAIAYATGKVTIGQMIRIGFVMNMIGVVVLTLVGLLIAPAVLG